MGKKSNFLIQQKWYAYVKNSNWKKNYLRLNHVAEKGNEMVAVKTKNVSLNINHRCDGNKGFEMQFN